jgi:hypothetical protein
MPVHDWRKVRTGKFHHFHNSWVYKLSDRLNSEILPPGFYAAGEQVSGDVEPDALVLEQSDLFPVRTESWHTASAVVAIAEHPPQVSITMEADAPVYLSKKDRVVIRSADDDRIIALIEIVSKANKDSRHRFEQFLKKIASALSQGFHLLVIDLHSRGKFDEQGIHGAVWEYLYGACPPASADRPLTLVSYRAEPVPTAFVEPIAVGMPLPDMPLFLDAGFYINVPLEETYQLTWSGFPQPWKTELADA